MAANLQVRLGLDSKGFQSGVAKAKSSISNMKSHVVGQFKGMAASMGAMLGAAYIGMQIKETIEWGSRIRDLADQFGMTTTFVQQMDYAFKQTGTDAEVAFKSIRKMMLKASLATQDLTSAATKMVLEDAFGKLGISVQDLDNLKPEDMFMKIAAAMKDADKNSKHLQEALNVVFGGKGTQLLVTFNSDLAAMSERLVELGAVVEEENIRNIGALGDKLEEFKTQNRGVWADIVGGGMQIFGGLITFVKTGIDIIAERMTAAFNGLKGLASAAGNIWKALKNRDLAALAAAKKDIKQASIDLATGLGGNLAGKAMETAYQGFEEGGIKGGLKGVAGLASVIPATVLGNASLAVETGMGTASKIRDDKEKGEARKEIKAIEDEQKAIGKLMGERQKHLDAIEKLEEKAAKRRFDQLTPEQQLLELQKKRVEEVTKLNKLQKPLDDVTKDKRLEGLEGQEKASMILALEEERKEYMEQQLATAGAIDAEKKARDKRQPKSADMVGGIKDSYTALSSIGGQIGAKNPLVDMQKESLDIQKQQRIALDNINNTMTVTFKG